MPKNFKMWWWVLTTMVLCARGFETSDKKGCEVYRTYGMLGADCSKRDLQQIPPDLSPRIEVLDASENDISDLMNDTFIRYTSLRFLYLGKNVIIFVAENAFTPLQQLEVLELTRNALIKIPYDVLALPSLRKLYLARNPLNSVRLHTYEGAPVSNSMKVLSLAQDKLEKLPPLWMVPQLEYLNVSGNNLQTIKVTDLAPMCLLKELDVSNNKRLFNSEINKCECFLFKYWIAEWNIRLEPPVAIDCGGAETENCRNSTTYKEAMDLRSKCNKGVEIFQSQVKMKRTWLWIGIAAGVVVGLILLIGLYLHCHNSSSRRINASNNNHVACEGVKVPPEQSSQLLQEL